VADRWQDLALMTRSLESDDLNPQLNGLSERFLERYGIEPDPEGIAFSVCWTNSSETCVLHGTLEVK
jgi:aminoglycoside phosphotransferase